MSVLALTLFTNVAAHASSYEVDSTRDSPDAYPGDDNCADALGDCTLRAAIEEANAHTGPDDVVLGARTYAVGTALGITDTVTVIGVRATKTVIDGGGQTRVFEIDDPSAPTVVFRNLKVTGGSADGGAAILARNDASVDLVSVHIDGNTSSGDGGGVLFDSLRGALRSLKCTFKNNTAAGRGGAMSVSGGTLLMSKATVFNNTADSGGGIYLGGLIPGRLLVKESAIVRNDAARGGGMSFFVGYGTLEMENVTLSENSASVQGGALDVLTGEVILQNATVAGNDAPIGAVGITYAHNNGRIVFRDSITNDNIGAENCVGITSEDHNLFGGACDIAPQPNDLWPASALLEPLAFNGGSTPTQAIPLSSPAVNAADDTRCPSKDQRGVARPQGGRCDIGAFEFSLP